MLAWKFWACFIKSKLNFKVKYDFSANKARNKWNTSFFYFDWISKINLIIQGHLHSQKVNIKVKWEKISFSKSKARNVCITPFSWNFDWKIHLYFLMFFIYFEFKSDESASLKSLSIFCKFKVKGQGQVQGWKWFFNKWSWEQVYVAFSVASLPYNNIRLCESGQVMTGFSKWLNFVCMYNLYSRCRIEILSLD